MQIVAIRPEPFAPKYRPPNPLTIEPNSGNITIKMGIIYSFKILSNNNCFSSIFLQFTNFKVTKISDKTGYLSYKNKNSLNIFKFLLNLILLVFLLIFLILSFINK